MTYSDIDIKMAMERGAMRDSGRGSRWIQIANMVDGSLQPASVDLRLGREFMFFPDGTQIVDLADRKVEMLRCIRGTAKTANYPLEPGGFALASTMERITLGSGIVGRVEGKSSLGRLGLMVHVTAGFIDPGFSGQVTLEFFNASPNTIKLRPGLFICQMSFSECKRPAIRPYGHPDLGSRYQDQEGVTGAKE